MTHTHPPHHQELAPRPEDDISRWIDVDSLCPDHDGQPASAEDSHGQYSSVQAPCDPAAGSEQRRGPSSSAKPGVTRERGVRHREDRAPGRVTSKADHAFYTMCFPANPAKPEGDKKRRRDFSHQRRLEVARVRRAGACIRCRIRRVSVGYQCVVVIGQGPMGASFCDLWRLIEGSAARESRVLHVKNQQVPSDRPYVRERSLRKSDLRVWVRCQAGTPGDGVVILTICLFFSSSSSSQDTHYIDVATHLLDQELIAGTTHVGPPRAVTVSLGSLDCPGLEVEVQDFYTRSSAGWLCCWAVVSSVDGCLDLFQEESSHYALTRLPDPETVIQWAEATTVHQDGRLIGLHQAMDSFILRYSKSELDLPMVSGAHRVSRRTRPQLTMPTLQSPEVACPESPPAQLPRQGPAGSRSRPAGRRQPHASLMRIPHTVLPHLQGSLAGNREGHPR